MEDQPKKNKSNPLSVFKADLQRDEFECYIKQLALNFNQDATTEFIDLIFQKYLSKKDVILLTSPSRIKLSTIGLYCKTHLNQQYWLDRGWNKEEAEFHISKRQATCTPEIAKKIQATLNSKSNEEKIAINKKKGNGLNPEWLSKSRGISLEEATERIHNQCSYAGKTKNELYKKLGKAVSNRQISFYIENGLSYEDAKAALRERQTTASKQAFIKKYGEEYGIIKYNERISKFKENWKNKTDEEKTQILFKRLNRNRFFSNESYLFFQSIESKLSENFNCLYGNDEFFLYDKDAKKIYFYDFCIFSKKIIIEYHGSFWHANPDKNSNDWKNSMYSYEQSAQKDEAKKQLAINNGFTYEVIWDYEKNNEKTINRLLNIITNKNE